jgi:tetratricopeptide (TPR) repeat protein
MLAQTSLDRWPTDYAHGVLGGELTHERRDAEALEHLRIGARVNPRARYNLGVSLFNLKRFDESRAALQQLVREYPWREEVPWSHRIIGHTYAIQRNYPEAAAEFRMVLAMTPGDRGTKSLLVETLDRQGVALGTAGDHNGAIQAFRGALSLDPANAGVQHNLATALLDSGNVPDGIAAAREAVALKPDDALSQNLLGRALAMQGLYDEALPHLEAAAKLNPQDAQMKEDLDRVRGVSTK